MAAALHPVLAGALLAIGPVLTTSAQIVPVSPFAGTHHEGFETQSSPAFVPCVLGGVFQDIADLCTPGSSGTNITTGWGYQCSLAPYAGAKFFGSSGGFAEFTFDGVVVRFGGYFATNSGLADATLNFFDPQDNLIGTQTASFPALCGWTWNGWMDTSGAGIKRVEVHGSASNGGFAMMDDLQVDVVLPDFFGTPSVLSNLAGGTQSLSLSAGAAHAGKTYLILGTLAGDAPGMFTNGLNIPINFDNYTLYCLVAPNTPPLLGSFGVLDAAGQGQASFTIPPVAHPLLPGMTAHHAYLVFGPGPVIEYASLSVPLGFTP